MMRTRPATRVFTRSRDFLKRAAALHRCDAVGREITLDGQPDVRNLGFISIGDRVSIRSSPIVSHLATGLAGKIHIGDDVRIAYGASISANGAITIETGARIGPLALILDSDFHEVGAHALAGGTSPIVIGRCAVLGPRVTVLRGSSIGAGAYVEAGSVVKGEVPAGARVAGVPARERLESSNGINAVTTEAVLRIVAETFGLESLPNPASPPSHLEAWDSLGTLNLLLSLEEAFDVALSGEDFGRLKKLADLVDLVQAAPQRA